MAVPIEVGRYYRLRPDFVSRGDKMIAKVTERHSTTVDFLVLKKDGSFDSYHARPIERVENHILSLDAFVDPKDVAKLRKAALTIAIARIKAF